MYKNLLHFFTQMIDYQRKQSYLQLHQKNKIPRKKIVKEVKHLYTQNCKTLMKDSEEDKNKQKDVQCSGTGRINIVNMSILPKVIYRYSAISTNIPMAFFHRNRIVIKFM